MGCTKVYFCWICAAGLSEPLACYSLFLWPIIDPILVILYKCKFCDPNLTGGLNTKVHSVSLNSAPVGFACFGDFVSRSAFGKLPLPC